MTGRSGNPDTPRTFRRAPGFLRQIGGVPAQGVARAVAAGTLILAAASCGPSKLEYAPLEEVSVSSVPQPLPKEPGAYKIGRPYEIQGTWYYPRVEYDYLETGIASWYGPGFHGRATANGEIYDQEDLTAAHRTLPMPSMVMVTNLENGRTLKLRVNDRGPFARGRIIDVSRYAAELLGFEDQGTAKVRVQILDGESRKLAAAALGREDPDSTPSAAPTVSVSVAPLGAADGQAAPKQGAAPAANGSRAVPDVYGLQSASKAPQGFVNLPQPDGVVTVVPERAESLFVQVGAFSFLHNAKRLQVRLIPLVGRGAELSPVVVNGTHFYRVRFGPLASVQEADRLFETLIDGGYKNSRIVVE